MLNQPAARSISREKFLIQSFEVFFSTELLSGAAYFDVSQELRPFKVATGRLLVEVTGTRFSVQQSSNGAQVSVAEGSVRVSDTADGTAVRALERGRRVVADDRGRIGDVLQISPDKVGAWRRNRLVYEEAPLSTLVGDLNRYRDRPIELLDSRLAAETITATFDTAETDLILATLAELYPLEVVEAANRTELRRAGK